MSSKQESLVASATQSKEGSLGATAPQSPVAEANARFGVYLHSSGEQGGYVVRTMRDGTAAAPYLHAVPVHAYRKGQEHLAQRMADKLNLDRFGPRA